MKKICVFTGSRAEYGLLKPLMEEIKQDSSLSLQLLVSGMHLSPEFGNTYQLIEKDNFTIHERVETVEKEDSAIGTCKSISRGIVGYAEAFKRLCPDLLVLLGDRSEVFAAATAALLSQVPIAHLHGGEITEGAYDDAFRHAISKMSHLHFVSTEIYRQRVIQLGEPPDSVHNVGAIGLDYLESEKFLERNALEKILNFHFDKITALVTFHPVTLEHGTAKKQFQQLLNTFDQFKNLKIIFTKANVDTEGRIINQMIDDYVAANPERAISFISMGHLNYLSSMRFVDMVVGNSSSGILEAPSFGIPTINIGNRQTGRIKAASIVDCDPEQSAIILAIDKALSSQFKSLAKKVDNPYRKKKTAQQIREIIKKTSIGTLKKSFHNLPHKNL